jgi:transcription termination factor Rho
MSQTTPLRTGILEISTPGGHGMLRDPFRNVRPSPQDPVVDRSLIERFQLGQGVQLTGAVLLNGGGKPPALAELIEIEGRDPSQSTSRRSFDDLTAIDPRERLRLETGAEPLSTRAMDLFTPIGKGQRGLIVAAPRTGKTVLLQQVAQAVATNHPEVVLMVLLVDERPEEVTEMRRTIRGEVAASSNDRPSEEHTRLAQLVVDRGRRIAESGRDALILLDSLTRLGRAYNKTASSGRTLSGGVDIRALDVPKRLFGAARAFEEGGSLTILATCLIETNSRMDDVIFQEFKGTGNMELVLDRKLADRRIWPAFELPQSGSRKEERLLDAETLRKVSLLRRTLGTMKPVEAMEGLLRQLRKFPTNREFLDRIGATGQH